MPGETAIRTSKRGVSSVHCQVNAEVMAPRTRKVNMRNTKILTAEAVVTFISVLGGPDTTVFAGNEVGASGIAHCA
jgi:hypothetical protein